MWINFLGIMPADSGTKREGEMGGGWVGEWEGRKVRKEGAGGLVVQSYQVIVCRRDKRERRKGEMRI